MEVKTFTDIYEWSSEIVDGVGSDTIYRRLKEIYDGVGGRFRTGDGKLDSKFMKQVSGDGVRSGYFKWTSLVDGRGYQRARVSLRMNNPEQEYYFLSMMTDSWRRDIPNRTESYFTGDRISGYGAQATVIVMMKAFLDAAVFLTAERIPEGGTGRIIVERKSGRGRPRAIISPDTGRRIDVGGRTYKKIYRQIVLNGIVKDLSHVNTIDYKIRGNCVKSYVKEYYGVDVADKYIPDAPTYVDIAEMCEKIGVSLTVSTITGHLLYNKKEDGRKKLDIIVTQGHMFVRNDVKPSRRGEVVIKNKGDIYGRSNCDLIVLDEKLFDTISKELSKKFTLTDYSDNKIPFKTNTIILDPDYIQVQRYREEHELKSKTMFSLIDRVYGLQGYMNKRTFDEFYSASTSNVICYNKYEHAEPTVRIDANKAYVSQLYGTLFPVPDVNDYIEKFGDDDEIKEGGFYYCVLKKYDTVGCDRDRFYCYDWVVVLEENGYLDRITHKLETKTTTVIEDQYLPPTMYKDSDGEIIGKTSFATMDIVRYIGYLMKRESCVEHSYSYVGGEEEEALLDLHKKSSCRDGKFTLCKTYTKHKTGLLAWIAIVQLTNLQLFLQNRAIHKKNKGCELISVKTDSLGYIFKDDNYEIPNIKKNTMGKFKIEKENKVYSTDSELGSDYMKESDPMPSVKKQKLKKLDASDIEELIDDEESFILQGIAGNGKSYMLQHTIIPYLKKKGFGYIVTSTTIEQGKDLADKLDEDVVTIQKICSRDNDHSRYEMMFKKINYLIIDEAVQLNQELLKKLEHIKLQYDVQLIALCDKYQCVVDNYGGKPYIDTRYAYELFDSNYVEMKKHKNMRYTDEVYDILMYMIDNWDEDGGIKDKMAKKFDFTFVKTTKTKYNIAYTNKKCKEIGDDKHDCHTVHSVQGKTLGCDYTIHEYDKMPFRVLFTAISRCKDIEQVAFIR
jgi:hypothetical protein